MPKLGEVVTFVYQSFSQRAIPVQPVVVRIRDDVLWEEVVANYIRETPRAHLLNGNLLFILFYFAFLRILILFFILIFLFYYCILIV